MSRFIRTVVALLLLEAGAMVLPLGQAGAVEQGTISVHVTWPNGKPSEPVEICFAVTSDAAGTDILGSKCTNSDENLAVFGPSDPPLATGVTYDVWRAEVPQKGPDAGAVNLLEGPVEAVIPDTTGNVDITWEMKAQTPDATLTVHNSACPAGAQPGNLFDACHANGLAGVGFVVDGTAGNGDTVHRSGTTEGDLGTVTFTLPAGDYTLAQAVMSGDFASFQVYCSTSDGTQVPVEDRSNGRAAIALSVGSGQEIVCDWYNIPAEAAPTVAPTQSAATEAVVQPTPPAAATTPVVQLPATGAGPGTASTPWIVAALAGLALVAVTASLLLRRRTTN